MSTNTILDKATLDGKVWILSKSVESLIKPGGGLKVITAYHIERDDGTLDQDNRCNIRSEREARNYFSDLCSEATIVERTGASALNRLFGG